MSRYRDSQLQVAENLDELTSQDKGYDIYFSGMTLGLCK